MGLLVGLGAGVIATVAQIPEQAPAGTVNWLHGSLVGVSSIMRVNAMQHKLTLSKEA